MNRRSFLGLSGASLAGFALDPERLLWVPGQRSYFDLGQRAARLPVDVWFDAVWDRGTDDVRVNGLSVDRESMARIRGWLNLASYQAPRAIRGDYDGGMVMARMKRAGSATHGSGATYVETLRMVSRSSMQLSLTDCRIDSVTPTTA